MKVGLRGEVRTVLEGHDTLKVGMKIIVILYINTIDLNTFINILPKL